MKWITRTLFTDTIRISAFSADVASRLAKMLKSTSAENALIRIVSVKRVRVIHFIRLGPEGNFLMLHGHQLGCVMHRAIAVVIVTDGAVEHVISKNPIERFP